MSKIEIDYNYIYEGEIQQSRISIKSTATVYLLMHFIKANVDLYDVDGMVRAVHKHQCTAVKRIGQRKLFLSSNDLGYICCLNTSTKGSYNIFCAHYEDCQETVYGKERHRRLTVALYHILFPGNLRSTKDIIGPFRSGIEATYVTRIV